MGSDPSKPAAKQDPVDRVTLERGGQFCRRLSEMPAEKAAGAMYRLPTEAEWEYACRAGTNTRYSFGDSAAEVSRYAWWPENSMKNPPCRQVAAERLGTVRHERGRVSVVPDLTGFYDSTPTVDPTGPKRGPLIIRGWVPVSYSAMLHVGSGWQRIRISVEFDGFRVARTIAP